MSVDHARYVTPLRISSLHRKTRSNHTLHTTEYFDLLQQSVFSAGKKKGHRFLFTTRRSVALNWGRSLPPGVLRLEQKQLVADWIRTEWSQFIQLQSSYAHSFLIYSFTVHSLSVVVVVRRTCGRHTEHDSWLELEMGKTVTPHHSPDLHSQQSQYVLCPSSPCSTTISDYCLVVVCRWIQMLVINDSPVSVEGLGICASHVSRGASLCVCPTKTGGIVYLSKFLWLLQYCTRMLSDFDWWRSWFTSYELQIDILDKGSCV